jgi:hypothetical protein
MNIVDKTSDASFNHFQPQLEDKENALIPIEIPPFVLFLCTNITMHGVMTQ